MKKIKNLSVKTVILLISLLILGLSMLQHYEPVQSSSFFSDLFRNAPDVTKDILERENRVVVSEESVITKVVEDALPSVVTIGITTTSSGGDVYEFNPFNPFSPFQQRQGEEETIEQNIGSGFIISENGIVITNKHVVREIEAEYTVFTHDEQEYTVENIYRDPLNDLAILKINATNLDPLELGDSSQLKLGQLAIAIGTPLGEFTNTVTSGIVSGLGRGITAGSPFEGFVEQLDNVIQTDAAISPGNSGGPLLNSAGQVIGVNTAIASEGQNIGFAIPVNVVKDLMKTFENQGGSFERPYIGVRYTMVDRRTAILNDVVEGAYVESVVEGSPADEAGIVPDDIITQIEGKKLSGDDNQALAKIILEKRIGDTIELRIWREGEMQTVTLTLEGYNE